MESYGNWPFPCLVIPGFQGVGRLNFPKTQLAWPVARPRPIFERVNDDVSKEPLLWSRIDGRGRSLHLLLGRSKAKKEKVLNTFWAAFAFVGARTDGHQGVRGQSRTTHRDRAWQ